MNWYCHNSQFKDVERRSNYELYLKMKSINGYKDCLLYYYYTILSYYTIILLYYYTTILLLYYYTITILRYYYYTTILLYYYYTITIIYNTILYYTYYTILLYYYYTTTTILNILYYTYLPFTIPYLPWTYPGSLTFYYNIEFHWKIPVQFGESKTLTWWASIPAVHNCCRCSTFRPAAAGILVIKSISRRSIRHDRLANFR